MAKTVKNIAKDLSINPLRVYRFISKQNIKPIKTENGTNFFSLNDEKLIERHFLNDGHYRKDNRDNHFDNDVKIIELLEKEIKTKNNQIDSLQKSLNNQQKLLDQQQQLSLNDKKLISEKDNTINELTTSLNVKKYKKWFQFWK